MSRCRPWGKPRCSCGGSPMVSTGVFVGGWHSNSSWMEIRVTGKVPGALGTSRFQVCGASVTNFGLYFLLRVF